MSGRVFVVTGAKGGTGASTLTFELGRRLRSGGQRVIVDGDLAGRRTHAVWFDVAAQLDAERAPGVPAVIALKEHGLIEMTARFEDGFIVKPPAVEKVLAPFPEDTTFVIDAPQPFAAAVRPLVGRALRFLLVAEPTLLGIGGARSLLTTMNRFGIPSERVVLIVNSRDGSRDLSKNDIRSALGISVFAEIPPKRDRHYQRALAALADELDRMVPAEPIADLRRAAAYDPVGDRRSEPRPGRDGGPMNPPRADGIVPLDGNEAPQPEPEPEPEAPVRAALDAQAAAREAIKAELHAEILGRMDFGAAARLHSDQQKMSELRTQVAEIAETLIAARKDVASLEEATQLKAEVVGEALGYGPLESFLDDGEISEIMVNGHENIFVERKGRIEHTGRRFADDAQVRLVIERIIAPLGRRLDEASPMVDARLPDGSRVNAIVEPLAIDGPSLTIRRFGKKRLQVSDLVKFGALTDPMVDFLRACVEARLNIVVSGGTGSGKTTLLNALSSFIPKHERIVTIEDAAELSLDQPHVVRLESRPANLEGKGEIRIRELVRNSLRMRPDRIVVGECRGGESLDMLQAMNTGHDGSLTTAHANTPRDALSRIETMVLMAGFDLPVRAIREQIASAVDVIVQVARLRDGTRKVLSIAEIVGMEGDIVTMQEIVRYRQRGLDEHGKVQGTFESTGVQPTCLKRFDEMGIPFDPTRIATMERPTTGIWAAQ